MVRRSGRKRSKEANMHNENRDSGDLGKVLAISSFPGEIRVAVLDNNDLVEFFVGRNRERSIAGDIYLGRVENVLPGMEAAFVNIAHERNALLYMSDMMDSEKEKCGGKISRALKIGQSILVQVKKDPMGTKGARISTNISFAGRFAVLLPKQHRIGVSKKLSSDDRQRLRSAIKTVKPDDAGVIIRTLSSSASDDQIVRDIKYLSDIWRDVKSNAQIASPPALLYREPDIDIRVVRDVFSSEFGSIIADSYDSYWKVRNYIRKLAPELVGRVEKYTGIDPLFDKLGVTAQIQQAFKRSVQLPSGGTIIIDRTEAMTVIDVNTARFVGSRNLEDTIIKTNLEAVVEIVRQLRLRDIGGIILIDFIDMENRKNKDLVLKKLKSELETDRTRTQVLEITKLGLVEMTRKNVSEGIIEKFSDTCPHCSGRGVLFYDLY